LSPEIGSMEPSSKAGSPPSSFTGNPTFDVKLTISSRFAVFPAILGVFLLALLPFMASANFVLDIFWIALCLVMIIPGVTGATHRGNGRAVFLGLRPLKGRLVYGPSEITIYSLDLFAGSQTSGLAIEGTELGNSNVKFKVRGKRGLSSVCNVSFSPDEFEGFKKLIRERKPSMLSWEFG